MKQDKFDLIFLRFGLGFVFIYAGISALTSPDAWIGFMPTWINAVVNRETFLVFHAIGEISIGVLLAVGFALRVVAVLAALNLSAILLFFGIDAVTFRDVGLTVIAIVIARAAWRPA